MIYAKITRNGNTLIRAGYPYGRGNTRDRYLFRGRDLFDALTKTDSPTVRDIPAPAQAMRAALEKAGVAV
jgi:hypothetical protein